MSFRFINNFVCRDEDPVDILEVKSSHYDMGFYCFLMVISVVIKIGLFDLVGAKWFLWGGKGCTINFPRI